MALGLCASGAWGSGAWGLWGRWASGREYKLHFSFLAPLRGGLPPSGVGTPADAGERPRQMFAKGYGWSATA